jgi:hypothetical protein
VATKQISKNTEINKISKSEKKQCKDDALALAQVIYDVYKNKLSGARITNGQNDAQTTSS